jgi:uncharacterized protein YcfJ
MKRIALLALVAGTGAAAFAQPQGFTDRARVQHVEPQYQAVQIPREECSNQLVSEPRTVQGAPVGSNGYGGAVIGGVAGAIVGNQVGKGHGREAATAAGAVIGALAGDRISNQNSAPPQTVYEQREVRSCRTVNTTENRLTGYRVTYEYRGNQFVTVMPEQPGNTIPVRVSVVPEPEYHRR